MNLKENEQKQGGTSRMTRSLRMGSMTILFSALVIAIAIVLNILLSMLPVTYTEFDWTDRRLYTLTDTTKTLVSNLPTDVSIYVICEKGEEESLLQTTLKRYDALSDRLKVEYVDPMLNPGMVSLLTQGDKEMLTTENEEGKVVPANNSLIITGPARYKIIYIEELAYIDYDMEEYMSAVLTGTTISGTQYYSAEKMITSAIDYVLASDIPVYYNLFGHDEGEFSNAFLGNVGISNIQVKDLDLLTVSNGSEGAENQKPSLPADADGLIIYNPKIDYNTVETEMIRTFLKQGGDLLLFTNYSQLKNLPNLLALMEEYGVTAESHWVEETNSSYHAYGDTTTVIPGFNSNEFLTSGRVLMYRAHNLKIAQSLPTGVKVTPILKAQTSARLRSSVASSNGFEIVDENGGYTMAVSIEAANENADAAKIVWFPTDSLVNELVNMQGLTANELSSGTNHRFVISALSWMSGKDATIAIDAIALGTGVISVTERIGVIWGIVLIGVIPGAVAIGGVLYYRKRRRAR